MAKKEDRWPKIRQVEHKNGTKAWMVDGRRKGLGERFFFSKKSEADTKADQLRLKVENEGTAAISIPDSLRVEAVECAKLLEPAGVSLREAVAYYLKHARPATGEKNVAELVTEFLQSKAKNGRRASYISVQKYVLENGFAAAFGERPIHEINHIEIEKWVDGKKWALRTRRNYLRDVRNLFGFAIRRGYCGSNPMERIEEPTVPVKPPGILTVDQAAALLTAAGVGEGRMLAPIAIGLFCGVRSAELQKLQWEHVNLEAKTIEITAENAKMGERRIVDVPDNLVAWLQPLVKASGPVAMAKASFNHFLAERAKAAKIPSWPKNAMRHSFASYHYAHHRNAALTVAQLGHFGDTRTFVTSYRGVVQPSEALKFWALMPAPPLSRGDTLPPLEGGGPR